MRTLIKLQEHWPQERCISSEMNLRKKYNFLGLKIFCWSEGRGDPDCGSETKISFEAVTACLSNYIERADIISLDNKLRNTYPFSRNFIFATLEFRSTYWHDIFFSLSLWNHLFTAREMFFCCPRYFHEHRISWLLFFGSMTFCFGFSLTFITFFFQNFKNTSVFSVRCEKVDNATWYQKKC